MQEGALALYKGWLPSVIGVVPYVGLNFAVYETLKACVLDYYGKDLGALVGVHHDKARLLYRLAAPPKLPTRAVASMH